MNTTKRKIVCLCGNPELLDAFMQAEVSETLAAKIVLNSGISTLTQLKQTKPELFRGRDWEDLLAEQEALHLEKVLLADEILVVSAEGAVDKFTRRCIWQAFWLKKPIRFTAASPAVQAEIIRQAAEYGAKLSRAQAERTPSRPARTTNL